MDNPTKSSENINIKPQINPKDREITKAIYLIGTKSAAYNGHASLLLVDKNGYGIFYSTIFSVEKTPSVFVGNYAPLKIYRQELSPSQIEEYFKSGKIPNVDNKVVKLFYLSNFDKYIMIPIESKKQGKLIYQRAESIYKNPGLFNLYQYNCNHVTQDMLSAGGVNFAPSKGDLEMVKQQGREIMDELKKRRILAAIFKTISTYKKCYEVGIIPNGAFEIGLKWAKEKNYEHGTIDSRSIYKTTNNSTSLSKLLKKKAPTKLEPGISF